MVRRPTLRTRSRPEGANAGTLDEIPPDTSMQWGIPSVSGYGPLILSRYSAVTGIDSYGQVPDAIVNDRDQTLNILSARFVLFPVGHDVGDSSGLASVRWRKVENNSGASVIYENAMAMPRAWLASDVVSAKPEEILRAIKTSTLPDGGSFNPAATALIEDTITFHSPSEERARSWWLSIRGTPVPLFRQVRRRRDSW